MWQEMRAWISLLLLWCSCGVRDSTDMHSRTQCPDVIELSKLSGPSVNGWHGSQDNPMGMYTRSGTDLYENGRGFSLTRMTVHEDVLKARALFLPKEIEGLRLFHNDSGWRLIKTSKTKFHGLGFRLRKSMNPRDETKEMVLLNETLDVRGFDEGEWVRFNKPEFPKFQQDPVYLPTYIKGKEVLLEVSGGSKWKASKPQDPAFANSRGVGFRNSNATDDHVGINAYLQWGQFLDNGKKEGDWVRFAHVPPREAWVVKDDHTEEVVLLALGEHGPTECPHNIDWDYKSTWTDGTWKLADIKSSIPENSENIFDLFDRRLEKNAVYHASVKLMLGTFGAAIVEMSPRAIVTFVNSSREDIGDDVFSMFVANQDHGFAASCAPAKVYKSDQLNIRKPMTLKHLAEQWQNTKGYTPKWRPDTYNCQSFAVDILTFLAQDPSRTREFLDTLTHNLEDLVVRLGRFAGFVAGATLGAIQRTGLFHTELKDILKSGQGDLHQKRINSDITGVRLYYTIVNNTYGTTTDNSQLTNYTERYNKMCTYIDARKEQLVPSTIESFDLRNWL